MNGRVYDASIARFLSADPHIQAPSNTQSYNRYSYVLNNPMKYTDPSGFFFSGVKRWIKKNKKAIISVVIVVAAIATGGLAVAAMGLTGLTGAVVAGAISGALSGYGIAVNYGATHKQGLSFARKGAITGALTAGVGYGLDNASTYSDIEKILIESGVSGLNSEISGGSFEDGFKVALVTSSAKYLYQNYSTNYNTNGDEPHILQEGKSNAGIDGSIDENGKLSDQSCLMRKIAKIPGFDSMAEFHDGWVDSMPIVDNSAFLTAITILPALSINYAATYHMYLPYIQIANSVQGKDNINGKYHENFYSPIY